MTFGIVSHSSLTTCNHLYSYFTVYNFDIYWFQKRKGNNEELGFVVGKSVVNNCLHFLDKLKTYIFGMPV